MHEWSGTPASYLRIDAPQPLGWQPGNFLSFSLPMRLSVTRYTGLTVIPGHDRFAVEYGPILLAAVGGQWNRSIDSMLVPPVARPEQPDTWLQPSTQSPLHFNAHSSSLTIG